MLGASAEAHTVLQRVLAFQSNDFLCRQSCFFRADPDYHMGVIHAFSNDMCRKVADLEWSEQMAVDGDYDGD